MRSAEARSIVLFLWLLYPAVLRLRQIAFFKVGARAFFQQNLPGDPSGDPSTDPTPPEVYFPNPRNVDQCFPDDLQPCDE